MWQRGLLVCHHSDVECDGTLDVAVQVLLLAISLPHGIIPVP